MPKLVLLFFICYLVTPFPLPAQELASELRELAGRMAVDGYEEELSEYLRSRLPSGARVETDALGNLYAEVGSGRPHFLFAAAIDEVGYVVSGITDNGFLTLQRLSRRIPSPLYDQFHEGQPVVVHARNRKVPGVIVVLSTHLHRFRPQVDSIFSLEEAYVDIGASSRAEVERLGVSLLDPVTIANRFAELAGGRFAGVALSTRGHALAMLEALRKLSRTRAARVTFAWTTQEAMGRRGIDGVAERVKPDAVFILTSEFGLRRSGPPAEQKIEETMRFELGRGPVVERGDIEKAAAAGNISVQPAARPELEPAIYSGGPKWSTQRVMHLGLPVKYKDTLVEVVDLKDIEALSRLIVVLAESKGAGS